MGRVVELVLAIVLAVAMTAPLFAQGELTVLATGQSVIRSEADSDAARRRALSEALVNAALAGGAQLVGYSAMSQARITRDLTLLRTTGQVLSHRVLDARREGQSWIVQIEAEVGPLAARACAGGRNLTLSVLSPRIVAPSQGPAWAGPLAQTIAAGLVDRAARHPRVSFEGVLPAQGHATPVPAALDYNALTRGIVAPDRGDHILALDLRLDPQGGALSLTTDLTLTGPDGRSLTRQLSRQTRLPSGTGFDLLTGRSRTQAERALSAGLHETLDALLDAAGCEAPSAILARSGSDLSVPIGQRHGLSRGSLGVVEGAGPETGLLEIVTLADERAILRPLDPAVSAEALVGARLHFVETGL